MSAARGLGWHGWRLRLLCPCCPEMRWLQSAVRFFAWRLGATRQAAPVLHPSTPPPLHPSTPPRYEVPDIQFEKLAVRFMDIRKRVYDVRRAGIALWLGGGRWCITLSGQRPDGGAPGMTAGMTADHC